VLPPDVNRSETRFDIQNGEVRFGLLAIKNVGSGAADSIVKAAREKPFKTIDDFCARVDLHAINKKCVESLIKAGAMDGLRAGEPANAARARLLAAVDRAVGAQVKVKADLDKGQGLLFMGGPAEDAAPAAPDPAIKALSEHDTLAFEREVLGFYFSGHPLLSVKPQLKAAATHEVSQLTPAITTPVRLAGMISRTRKMVSKKTGEPWVICTLEDLTGEITALCFPKTYAAGVNNLGKVGAFVAVTGRLSFKGEEVGAGATAELIVDEMAPLDQSVTKFAKRLRLKCDPTVGTEKLEQLRDALEKHPGTCPVVLEQETQEGLAMLDTELRVVLNQALFEAVEAVLGERCWSIEASGAPAVIAPRRWDRKPAA
jgi:DNA polymerase-3 subunit alpha